MRTYGVNLLENQCMNQVTRPQAKKLFDEGKTIYAKITPTMWVGTSIKDDEELPEFEYGIKFYVLQEFDDDKLIVTRHPNIAEYYRSKGINARVVQVTRPSEASGKTLYGGNIPAHIMACAKETYILSINNTSDLEFDAIPSTEFDNLGCVVRKYVVNTEYVDL